MKDITVVNKTNIFPSKLDGLLGSLKYADVCAITDVATWFYLTMSPSYVLNSNVITRTKNRFKVATEIKIKKITSTTEHAHNTSLLWIPSTTQQVMVHLRDLSRSMKRNLPKEHWKQSTDSHLTRQQE